MQRSSFFSSFVVTTNKQPSCNLLSQAFVLYLCRGRKHFPCSNFFLVLFGFENCWVSSKFDQKVTSPDFLFLVEGVSFFVLCFVTCVFVEDFWWHFHLFVCVLVSFWWHFVVFEKAARRGRENKEVGDGC